jgi:VHL beta domain
MIESKGFNENNDLVASQQVNSQASRMIHHNLSRNTRNDMRPALQTFLICVTGLIISPTWSQERSTGSYQNLRINAQWLESDTLEFTRKNEGGEVETVRVNAVTGEMKIETLRRDGKSQLVAGRPPASESAGSPATLTFENRSQHTVRMFWIDTGGKRHSYGELTPHQSKQQPTYAGHTWQVVSLNDKLDFGNLVADSPRTRVVIEKPLGKLRAM